MMESEVNEYERHKPAFEEMDFSLEEWLHADEDVRAMKLHTAKARE